MIVSHWYSIAAVVLFCILVNVPFGMWRATRRKFSVVWFIAVHAPVPLVIALRLFLKTPTIFIPLFILASVAGQFIGGRFQKMRVRQP